jgi:hypothetical protein
VPVSICVSLNRCSWICSAKGVVVGVGVGLELEACCGPSEVEGSRTSIWPETANANGGWYFLFIFCFGVAVWFFALGMWNSVG